MIGFCTVVDIYSQRPYVEAHNIYESYSVRV